MHKYQPRIHLVKRPDGENREPIDDLDREPHKTFVFPEAIFTAVTAYQNQLVSFFSFWHAFVVASSRPAGVGVAGQRRRRRRSDSGGPESRGRSTSAGRSAQSKLIEDPLLGASLFARDLFTKGD
jgi:hypothetical protein